MSNGTYHTTAQPANLLTLTRETMAKAIARAKQLRPSVKWLGGRSYAVSGSKGNTYKVTFASAHDYRGKQVLLGSCDCEAGQREMVCYHQASAIGVHIALSAMRSNKPIQFPAVDTRPDVAQVHGYEMRAA